MPNLWPALLIKPDVVYNICTSKTARVAENLRTWLKHHGERFGVAAVVRALEIPQERQLEDSFGLCEELLAKHTAAEDDVFINYTGGTKLMSGAGLIAAMKNGRAIVVYAEAEPMQIKCVHNVLRYRELQGGQDKPAEIRLDVGQILDAHGMIMRNQPVDWRLYKQAAVAVWRARGKAPGDWEDKNELVVEDIKKPETARAALLKPVEELITGSLAQRFIQGLGGDETVAALTDPALRLFEIWAEDGKLHLPHDKVERCLALLDEYDANDGQAGKDWNKQWYPAVASVQTSLNFLSGGWWEILSAWSMEDDGYDEILWSVETAYRTPPKDRKISREWESDIVACKDNQLTVVSCKRGSKELNELFAHSERTKALGGSAAVAKLSYYRPFEHIAAEKLRLVVEDGNTVLAKIGLGLA